jgi:hypothetical protein
MRYSEVRHKNTPGSTDRRAILKFDLVIPLSRVLIFKLQIHLCGVQVRMSQPLLYPPEINMNSNGNLSSSELFH